MALSRYKKVLADALSLNAQERSALAEELLVSIEPVDGPFDPAVADEWDEEIRRRVAELESGRARTFSHEEVMASIRKDLRRR